MNRKALMTLLLALAALPAAAQDFGGVFGAPLPQVAQLSPEERRQMRERWENAGPEERAAMRRTFQERMHRMQREPMGPGRMEGRERWRETGEGMGYGMGYEHRRYQEDAGYGPAPGSEEDERRGRGRGRR
ncbi:MAG: hypothetical protein AB1831_07045 [Pseudomonadota bacterium]